MVRHISIFFFKEEQKEEHMRLFAARLEAMEADLCNLKDYRVGRDCMERPPKGIPGVPEFGDMIQIVDFEREEDAFSYADHPAHVSLTVDLGDYLEKVVAFDLEL